MKYTYVGIALVGTVAVYALQPEVRPAASRVASAGRASRLRFEAAQRELRASGARSCSGSSCHGGATPLRGEDFLGDEYDRWHASGQGSHFLAFKALYDERSERMVKILIGPDAVAMDTPLCLACHSLDVPSELRNARFDIQDGVSCEACHGRSEKWFGPHHIRKKWRTEMTAEQREAKGYNDLRDVVRRAEKCLECHAGTDEKRVTHTMLAAGHPPLTLDLAGDLEEVPRHWKDEQSYLSASEGSWFHARVWAVGQAVALRESMRRLAAWAASDKPPDFAMFECYACHHDLDDSKSWRQRREFPKITGDPAWEAGTALLCRPLVDMFLPDAKAAFTSRLADLQRSVSIHVSDRSSVRAAAEELVVLAEQLVDKVAVTAFDFDRSMRIMRAIVEQREQISTEGYRAAEQALAAFLALYFRAVADSDKKPSNHESILNSLSELKNSLYSTVGWPDNQKSKSAPELYDPLKFREILEQLAVQIGS